MKYFSELTGKVYESESECVKEEKAFKKEQEEKEAAAKKKEEEKAARKSEVQAAYEKMIEAENEYKELRNKYVKDYKQCDVSYNCDSIADILLGFLRG